jgi:hypothetical protein
LPRVHQVYIPRGKIRSGTPDYVLSLEVTRAYHPRFKDQMIAGAPNLIGAVGDAPAFLTRNLMHPVAYICLGFIVGVIFMAVCSVKFVVDRALRYDRMYKHYRKTIQEMNGREKELNAAKRELVEQRYEVMRWRQLPNQIYQLIQQMN